MVEREKYVPYAAETLLVLAAVPELAKEMPESILLLCSKIVQAILQLPVFRNILEDVPGLHQILVHLGKIAQDDSAPEDEFVQRLGIGLEDLVAIVEGEHGRHPVGRTQTAQPGEEVVYGDARRGDDGAPLRGGKIPEVLQEEAHGPFVRKNKTHPAYFGSRMVMLSNL